MEVEWNGSGSTYIRINELPLIGIDSSIIYGLDQPSRTQLLAELRDGAAVDMIMHLFHVERRNWCRCQQEQKKSRAAGDWLYGPEEHHIRLFISRDQVIVELDNLTCHFKLTESVIATLHTYHVSLPEFKLNGEGL